MKRKKDRNEAKTERARDGDRMPDDDDEKKLNLDPPLI